MEMIHSMIQQSQETQHFLNQHNTSWNKYTERITENTTRHPNTDCARVGIQNERHVVLCVMFRFV